MMPAFFHNKYLLTSITVLLLGWAVWHAVQHESLSPHNDLRNRVVGARLQAAGQSPYLHQWKTGEPDTWLDPYERQEWAVNGNTVTPAVSVLFSGLNGLPFTTITTVWLVLSFACLAMLLFLIGRAGWRPDSNTLWLPVAALFGLTAAWQLHLYSGQVYIIYALLMAAWYTALQKQRYVWAAIWLALLVVCRLPATLVALPWLLLVANKRFWVTLVVTGVAMVGILALTTSVENWEHYVHSMQLHGHEIYGTIPTDGGAVTLPPVVEGISTAPNPALQAYGQHIAPDILSLQKITFAKGYAPPPVWFSIIFLVLAGVLVVALHLRRPLRQWATPQLVLAGFLLYMLAEYCIPAPRFTYNYIQWLFPVLVLAGSPPPVKSIRVPAYILFITGLLLNICKLSFLPDGYSVGELLCCASLLLLLWKGWPAAHPRK